MKIEHKYDVLDYLMLKAGMIGLVTNIKVQTGYSVSYYVTFNTGTGMWYGDAEILFKVNEKEGNNKYYFIPKHILGERVVSKTGIIGMVDIIEKNVENKITYYVKSSDHECWVSEELILQGE